jgi:hypothetical protein
MKYIAPIRSVLPMALLASLTSFAQDPVPATPLEPVAPENLNHFGLSYRMAFNIKVDFQHVGAFAARTDPGSLTGGAIDRFYDDGYNRVDVTDSNHGPGYEHTTWFWGYDESGQIQPSRENPQTVTMHSSSSTGTQIKNEDDEPVHGFEASYGRELFHTTHTRWGLEGAFGYSPVSVSGGAPINFTVTQISDVYTVPPFDSGPPLPPAGYRGTHFGPGPVIGDIPSRSTTTIPGTVSGNRRFEADLFNFRFGPYLEFVLSKRVHLTLNGGLALTQVQSDLSYNESATIAGVGVFNNSDSGSHGNLQAGFYGGGNVSVALSETWGAFAGAQFQDVGKYKHKEGDRQAVLNLSESIFVTFGVSYSF